MAIRLTETRLRQIIREEASRLREAAPLSRPPAWMATVKKIAAYNNPEETGDDGFYWIDEIPEELMVRLSRQLGGKTASNQREITRAMVDAGVNPEAARQICDNAYYMSN
jgi:hypothetical protein